MTQIKGQGWKKGTVRIVPRSKAPVRRPTPRPPQAKEATDVHDRR